MKSRHERRPVSQSNICTSNPSTPRSNPSINTTVKNSPLCSLATMKIKTLSSEGLKNTNEWPPSSSRSHTSRSSCSVSSINSGTHHAPPSPRVTPHDSTSPSLSPPSSARIITPKKPSSPAPSTRSSHPPHRTPSRLNPDADAASTPNSNIEGSHSDSKSNSDVNTHVENAGPESTSPAAFSARNSHRIHVEYDNRTGIIIAPRAPLAVSQTRTKVQSPSRTLPSGMGHTQEQSQRLGQLQGRIRLMTTLDGDGNSCGDSDRASGEFNVVVGDRFWAQQPQQGQHGRRKKGDGKEKENGNNLAGSIVGKSNESSRGGCCYDIHGREIIDHTVRRQTPTYLHPSMFSQPSPVALTPKLSPTETSPATTRSALLAERKRQNRARCDIYLDKPLPTAPVYVTTTIYGPVALEMPSAKLSAAT